MQIQYEVVPQALHVALAQFLQELMQLDKYRPTQCPHCASADFIQKRAEPLTYRCKACLSYFNPLTATPFNRLLPADWLAPILAWRVNRDTYQAIAERLDCSIRMVTHRDKVLMQVMQARFPALYRWYLAHNNVAKQQPNPLPAELAAQHHALKQKIHELLNQTQANCLYCDSSNTVKVGQRTAFRCKACRKGFNLLNSTPISRLRNADKWLAFIDLLVANTSNHAIGNQLGMNSNTIGRWRRVWCALMQQWGFNGLAILCRK